MRPTTRRSRNRRRRPRRPARSTASGLHGSVRRSPTKRPRPRWTSSPIISSAIRPASFRGRSTDRRATRSSSGQFITLHDPGVMVVTIGGDHEKQAEQRVLAAYRYAAAAAGPADVRRRARSISLSRRCRYADAARARRQSRLVHRRRQSRYAPGIANGIVRTRSPVRSIRNTLPTSCVAISASPSSSICSRPQPQKESHP